LVNFLNYRNYCTEFNVILEAYLISMIFYRPKKYHDSKDTNSQRQKAFTVRLGWSWRETYREKILEYCGRVKK